MRSDSKSMFKMTWPIFIELFLQMLVGNMDQVQLSHFNDTAVAAVGNANTIIQIVILLFNVTTLAAMILISQYRGAGDTQSVEKLYTLASIMNLVLGVAMAVVLCVFATPLFTLLRVPADALAEARSYLVITALALPFQALMLTFSSFMRAHAKMNTIMEITAVVNVLNVAGNALLINGVGFLPRMGASGAALSSAICRVIGMVLMLVAFLRTCEGARISLAAVRPFPKDLMKKLLAIGIPSGGESLSYNFSQAMSLTFVNVMGTYVVTTRMYAGIFANCIYMFVGAISQALQIVVGYDVGAGRHDEADKAVWGTLRLFLPLTLALSGAVAVFAGPLYGLLSGDARVVQLGQTIALVELGVELGRCVNVVMVRSLQAAGDIRFPVVISILSGWGISVGVGYVLGVVLHLGLTGIWVGFALDECLRAVLLLFRWKSGIWRTKKTI